MTKTLAISVLLVVLGCGGSDPGPTGTTGPTTPPGGTPDPVASFSFTLTRGDPWLGSRGELLGYTWDLALASPWAGTFYLAQIGSPICAFDAGFDSYNPRLPTDAYLTCAAGDCRRTLRAALRCGCGWSPTVVVNATDTVVVPPGQARPSAVVALVNACP